MGVLPHRPSSALLESFEIRGQWLFLHMGPSTMCDFHNFGLIFSNGGCQKGTRSVEKISNNVDFSLWGNRTTTWEYFLTFSSETKIMKIRHSVLLWHDNEEHCEQSKSKSEFFTWVALGSFGFGLLKMRRRRRCCCCWILGSSALSSWCGSTAILN